MFNKPYSSRHTSSGFSLVEIMVGMVIGMLGIIVMMQIYSVSEGQKRSTTGASDAQNNGAIALYGMQRDIRQAGYGFSTLSLFGCNITLPSGKTLTLAPAIINPPTNIIPAGDANSDTLLVMYGTTNGATQGNKIANVDGTGKIYTVDTPASFAVNDYVIAYPGTCAAPLVFDQVVAGANTTVATGQAGVAAGVAAGTAALFNMGQAPQPKVLAYAIRGGNLTVCNYFANDCSGSVNNTSVWEPIANNIVSLRAQYGRDAGTAVVAALPAPPAPVPNYVVDTYDQATPAASCGWVRTYAVRIALTARSQQYDKNIVTTTNTNAPTWEGNAALPIDLTGNTDWQHYRYKVFQTVVPLRNITWMGEQVGC